MKKVLFLLIAVTIVVSSCRKDIQTDDTIFIPVGEDVSTNLHGRVIDESGISIPEAEVIVNDKMYFTNGDGYFYIPNLTVPSDGFTINVRSQNNDKILKRVIPQAGTNTYEKIILNSSEPFFEFSNTIFISDSKNIVTVTIPQNSLVTDNLIPYDGIYFARVNYFDPTSQNDREAMPGNLEGISGLGEKVTLGSYGMVDIEVTTENGERLFLAPEKLANVRMRIPGSLISNAPEAMPTWRLDEGTGLWLEENETTSFIIDEDVAVYGFDISKLRYWNCDVKELNTNLEGTLVDLFNVPIENRLVQFRFTSNNQDFFCSGGSTNSLGEFNARVPKDLPLTISIYDQNCKDLIYQEDIGPFSEENNNIDIDAEISKETYTIKGTAIDCTGDINYSNSTVFLYDSDDNVKVSTQTKEDGSFSIHNICYESSSEERFRIGLLNLDTGNYTFLDSLFYSEIDIDLGNIIPCTEFTEYIDIVSGFGEISFNNPSAFLWTDSLIINAETNEGSFSLVSFGDDEGVNPVDFIEVRQGPDQVLTCTSQYFHTICSEAVVFTITEIETNQKYISGRIVGLLYTGEIQNPDFTVGNDISIEFRVLYQ